MDSAPRIATTSTQTNGGDTQPGTNNRLTAPMAVHTTDALLQGVNLPLHSAASQIIEQFTLPTEKLQKITEHFLVELRRGLCDASLPFQLPAFVTTIPTGAETGKFLTVDLGGTNCRICLVDLEGHGHFSVIRAKYPVPPEFMVNEKCEPLFDWLASLIQAFVTEHLQDRKNTATETQRTRTPLGFTFSFTCDQTSLSSGTLIHWDKGWDIPTAIGLDPCLLLQNALDAAAVLVEVVVLANDSVGTLLARAYTAANIPDNTGVILSRTIASVIVGTGTNAAYVEQLSRIKRHPQPSDINDKHSSLPSVMVINSEWGCWDDKLVVLPQTSFDVDIDINSSNPGGQMFEKMASGLYLGELFRLAVCELVQRGDIFTFKPVHDNVPLLQRDVIDTSLLSALAEQHASIAQNIFLVSSRLGVKDVGAKDVYTLQAIAASITTRAARLTGAALAAILIQSDHNASAPKDDEHTRLASKAAPSTSPAVHEDIFVTNDTKGHWAVASMLKILNAVSSGVRDILSCCFPAKPSQRRGSSQFAKLSHETSTSQSREEITIEDTAGVVTEIVDIGVTGSVIELHPTFEAEMLIAIHELPLTAIDRRRKLRTGLCSDGSAVGAALMAHAALHQSK